MPDIVANGIRIHYQVRGEGDPLILIMGLGADGSLWEDHVQVLEEHFRCILMDNRGAGHSDKPVGPYATRLMAADTLGLMDALGIDRARIAGISMGGAIAQELAIRYPARVHSQVLVSTWARCNAYATAIFEHFKRMRAVAAPSDFAELLQLWIYAAPYFEGHNAELLEARAEANENPMPLHAFIAQCDACITHDALDRLGEIRVPTLVTGGDADIFTPLSFSETIHRSIPGSELAIFPGCGHAHHWERLDEFNSRVLAFLQSHQ